MVKLGLSGPGYLVISINEYFSYFNFVKSGLGVIVQGSQRTFTTSCSSRPAIIQADEMNKNYKAEFALTRSEVEVRGTYWIAPDFGQYSFTMDMGCAVFVSGVHR